MYNVRRAKPYDLGDIVAMDEKCFVDGEDGPQSWDPELFWWVVQLGDQFVGYAGSKLWQVDDEKSMILHRCGVLEAHRGKGLHNRLLTTRIRHAKKLGCQEAWTYTSYQNPTSSNNLIKHGFKLWIPAHWSGDDPLKTDQEEAWLYWYKRLDDEKNR